MLSVRALRERTGAAIAQWLTDRLVQCLTYATALVFGLIDPMLEVTVIAALTALVVLDRRANEANRELTENG